MLIWGVIAGDPYLPSNTREYFKVQMKRLSVLLAIVTFILSGCVIVPDHHHDRGYYYGYPGGYYQHHHDWRGHHHYRR